MRIHTEVGHGTLTASQHNIFDSYMYRCGRFVIPRHVGSRTPYSEGARLECFLSHLNANSSFDIYESKDESCSCSLLRYVWGGEKNDHEMLTTKVSGASCQIDSY